MKIFRNMHIKECQFKADNESIEARLNLELGSDNSMSREWRVRRDELIRDCGFCLHFGVDCEGKRKCHRCGYYGIQSYHNCYNTDNKYIQSYAIGEKDQMIYNGFFILRHLAKKQIIILSNDDIWVSSDIGVYCDRRQLKG